MLKIFRYDKFGIGVEFPMPSNNQNSWIVITFIENNGMLAIKAHKKTVMGKNEKILYTTTILNQSKRIKIF